ncbi:hypothetical protein [Achromobacter mucicolens]|uniref:hypothetical protein n=1 Tax=Achromobacter mucicolens TaxID=1389922 RepID=UPI0011B1D2E6|nr:hypothetical protein [Achromobacter mucicolens]
MEHQNEESQASFDACFGRSAALVGSSNAVRLAMLTEVRFIVVRGEDNCMPRRPSLAAFDAGIGGLQKVERNRAAANAGAGAANWRFATSVLARR